MAEGEEGGDRGDTCPDPLLSGESHAFTGGAIRKSRIVSNNTYRGAYTRTRFPLRARLVSHPARFVFMCDLLFEEHGTRDFSR